MEEISDFIFPMNWSRVRVISRDDFYMQDEIRPGMLLFRKKVSLPTVVTQKKRLVGTDP